MAVTLERLIATKPRRVPSMCRTWNKCRTFTLIGLIYILSLTLSLYHFAWRRVVKRLVSNMTSNWTNSKFHYTWEMVSEKSEPVTYWYVQSSHLLFGLLVVVGPLLVLFLLNIIIVARLRSHNRNVGGSLFSGSDSGLSIVERIRRRERRVTLTVVVLVSVFIIFNLPSGLFSVVEFLSTKYIKVVFKNPWYWELGEACNSLVCTGKSVNFWLYCSASSDYRRELRSVLTCRRCRASADRRNEEDRSRSTSRVSSSCSGLRYRRSINWQMSEIYSNSRVTALASLL